MHDNTGGADLGWRGRANNYAASELASQLSGDGEL